MRSNAIRKENALSPLGSGDGGYEDGDSSVPDKRGVSGQIPDKVTYMTRQTDRKLVMIWWK